jgi:hypothetical protein
VERYPYIYLTIKVYTTDYIGEQGKRRETMGKHSKKVVVEDEKEMGNYEVESGVARAIFEKVKGGLLLRLPKEDAEKARQICHVEQSERLAVIFTSREIVFRKMEPLAR